MKQKLYKPNCFEKTEVRWGIFSFFSYTNVETKNFTPIAYNDSGIAEGRGLKGKSLNLTQMPNRSTND